MSSNCQHCAVVLPQQIAQGLDHRLELRSNLQAAEMSQSTTLTSCGLMHNRYTDNCSCSTCYSPETCCTLHLGAKHGLYVVQDAREQVQNDVGISGRQSRLCDPVPEHLRADHGGLERECEYFQIAGLRQTMTTCVRTNIWAESAAGLHIVQGVVKRPVHIACQHMLFQRCH